MTQPPGSRTVVDRVAMHVLGRELATLLRAGDLVILSGQLGAGKTTLTQGIGAGLGVRGPITSPTFALARTHPTLVGGPALLHVDAYRLSSLDDMVDLDLEESLTNCVVVVEWGEGKIDGLAEDRLLVHVARRLGNAADINPAAGAADPNDERAEVTHPHPTDLDAWDPDEEAPDPRTVTITAFGPRWQAVDLARFAS